MYLGEAYIGSDDFYGGGDTLLTRTKVRETAPNEIEHVNEIDRVEMATSDTGKGTIKFFIVVGLIMLGLNFLGK